MDDESSEEKMVQLYRSFLGDGNSSLVLDGDVGNKKNEGWLKRSMNYKLYVLCVYIFNRIT